MLLYSKQLSDETTTSEIRSTKSIYAFLFKTNQRLDYLNDAKVNIYIERANTDNFHIANRMYLNDFIFHSTSGTSMIDLTEGISVICEIADGAIELGSNESIKIEIFDLPKQTDKSGSIEIEIYGLEFPTDATHIHEYDTKNFLTEEKNKTFSVEDYDQFTIRGWHNVRKVDFTFTNGERVTYLREELEAISFDYEPIHTYDDGEVRNNIIPHRNFLFPLEQVVSIDVEKVKGLCEFTFRKEQY